MTTAQIVMLVVVVAIVAAVVPMIIVRSCSKRLRERIGPEYERTVARTGNRFKAEANLEKLEKRVSRYSVRSLSSAECNRFVEAWRLVQARFVDEPGAALDQADHLVEEVMAARGYPVADFEQRAAELSVDHAPVVQNYRAGHAIALEQSQGRATTEDLRKAMIYYRSLFEDLTGVPAQLQTRSA
jgi:hypothetical protein